MSLIFFYCLIGILLIVFIFWFISVYILFIGRLFGQGFVAAIFDMIDNQFDLSIKNLNFKKKENKDG